MNRKLKMNAYGNRARRKTGANAGGEDHQKNQEVDLFLHNYLREIFVALNVWIMRVKLGYRGLSVPQQVARSRNIVTKMTGNVNFATPSPPLSDLTSATDALEVAYNDAINRDSVLKNIMRLRQKEMLDVVGRIAAYVQFESGGDEEIILSSGFDVIKKGQPVNIGQVLNLRTVDGIYAGSIHAIWDRVVGAGAYIVEISSAGPGGPYVQYKVVLQTRIFITGLVPGALYWVRVTAVGRIDYGLPSDPSPHNAGITY